jgi:short-subunit dehydrogenase
MAGSNTFFYKVDLAKAEAIKSIATKIRSEHGDPTVLINNAGIEFNKPILGLEESQIRRTFDVNILAHFLLVQEFLPAMVSGNHGHVVSVASLASFTTSAINVDYACTKSAALAFYEGLSQELRHIYNAPGVRNS